MNEVSTTNEIILPTIVKYPNVLRDDMRVVDHVSLMLDSASKRGLLRFLSSKGIPTYYKDPNAPIGLTVAYSYQRLKMYPFKDPHLDIEPTFSELREPYFGPIAIESVKLKIIPDVKGNLCHVLLLLNNKPIEDLHKEIINRLNGEWSQGEYVPYIKFNEGDIEGIDQNYYDTINASLPTNEGEVSVATHEYLMFDTIRSMRFSEKV